jgi:hypothetical protein
MIPYLVQRATIKDNEMKTGIDSILLFDYMGSSEFEWGALPKSLKEIRAQIADYVYQQFKVTGRKQKPIKLNKKDTLRHIWVDAEFDPDVKLITVFCHKDKIGEVQEYLDSLAANKHHLKAGSHFNYFVRGEESELYHFDFWWDIENHFMFWKENEEFTNKFKGLIAGESTKQ